MAQPYFSTPLYNSPFTTHPLITNNSQDSSLQLSLAPFPTAPQRFGHSGATPTDATHSINNRDAHQQIAFPNMAHPVLPLVPPPPFHVPPELLKQFGSSSLPPPPFPPVPIPRLGFNHIAPSLKPPTVSTLSSTAFNGSQSYSQNLTQPCNDQGRPESHQNVHGPSREEGELSDGELEEEASPQPKRGNHNPISMDTSVANAKEVAPVEYRSSASEAPPAHLGNFPPAHKTNIPRCDLPTSNNSGVISHSRSDFENEQADFADSESISSYNPPSASTPDSEKADSSAIPLSSQMSNLGAVLPETKAVQSDDVHDALREQAKTALRSLHAHSIKFEDLIREGVSPYVLRSLYDDLENVPLRSSFTSLPVQLPAFRGERHAVGENPAVGQPPLDEERPVTQQPTAQEHSIAEETSVVGRPSFSDSHNFPPPGRVPQLGSLPRLPEAPSQRLEPGMKAGSVPNFTPHISPAQPVASSLPPKPLSTSIAAEPLTDRLPVSPLPSSAAMERKDRIAQLLAAKTGKRNSPHQPPESPSEQPSRSLQPQPEVLMIEKSPSPQEMAVGIRAEAAAKTKNKAQTELIKQKMEALRKVTLAKAQVQDVEDPRSAEPPVVLSAQSPLAEQRHTIPTADTTEIRLGFQIPGLFMASEVLQHHPDGTNVTSEGSPVKALVSPIDTGSAPVVARRESTATSDDAVAKPTTPACLPQKRPLASDSFDESTRPPKAPFGNKETREKVELVVSDTESGEIEDVEMELDEDSEDDRSGLQDKATEPLVPLPQQKASVLSSSTNLPLKPLEPNSSGIATPASIKAPASGGKDKGALWKAKQEEIEFIRKKIVEMEEKRRAKQNKTSTVGETRNQKTISPVIRTSLSRPPPQATQGAAKSMVKRNGEPLSPLSPTQPHMAQALPDSPLPAPSRMEEMPGTPATALHLPQEPLRGKTTRSGTPVAAELELRRAKLAEKRARLQELRQEAARREAEIREESEFLDIQVDGALTEETVNEQHCVTDDQLSRPIATIVEQKVHMSPLVDDDVGIENADGHFVVETEVQSQPQESTTVDSADEVFQPNILLTPLNNEDLVSNEELNPAEIQTPVASGPDAAEIIQLDLRNGSLSEHTMTDAPPHPPPYLDHAPAADEDTQLFVRNRSVSEGAISDGAQSEALDADSTGENGSVSMSDSGADDYEPAEPNGRFEGTENGQVVKDSEFYEPAEVVVPTELSPPTISMQEDMTNTVKAVGSSISSSPVPPQLSDQPIDTSISTDDAEDDMQLTEPNVVHKLQITPPSHIQVQDVDVDDEADSWHPDMCRPRAHFTPYETPRRFFKNFRYHDRYPDLVRNGYKSLTFSNNINPRKAFCPTDLAGLECQDTRCGMQHFRQVELTDDKILAQMSTADNLKSKEEHDRWVTGLRQVIADLRGQGVKDFHMVASALATYRRRFPEELSTTSTPSQP